MGVTVTGFDAEKRKWKDASKNVQQLVAREVAASAMKIAADAKRNAPANHGLLKKGISAKKIDDLNWQVVSNSHYALYVETGTKNNARVPDELLTLAQGARGAGLKGTLSAKEAIYEWCRSKRIDKRFWFPIYRKIMKSGIKPHPYLIPAFRKELPLMKERIRKAMQNKFK